MEDYVIIRSDRAGVFFGELESSEPCGDKLKVKLSNCRRLWYWDGAASISQLANNGTSKPDSCKFTLAVKKIVVIGVIEIIPCSSEAVESINKVKEWRA